jgi:hypothetical protein
MVRLFCTDLAIAKGEPQEGLGALAERHLFIRWPKGKWRRPRYMAADMSAALQGAMKASMGHGRYVGLVDSGDGTELELLSFPDGRRYVPADQAEAAALVIAWGEGQALPGEVFERQVILCCTDAKTDACCARYGFPVYKALAASTDAFDVLQCTHIGGCHFAPSVIVMPNRDRYGRLTPADVPAFLDALSQGQYFLPAFKGRNGLDEARQTAEIAAMRWAEGHGYAQAAVQLDETADISVDDLDVRFSVAGIALSVALTRTQFDVQGNCRDIEAEAFKPVGRWTVSGVSAR